jgi:hypothetical protein
MGTPLGQEVGSIVDMGSSMTNVLFLHGIRSDPTISQWAEALAAALARRGTGRLDDRGIGTIAASWKDALYGREPVEDPGPPDLTYVKSGDASYDNAVGRWSLRQAELEGTLRRRGSLRSGPFGALPDEALDRVAPAVASQALKEIGAYSTSRARRHACLRSVLAQVPEQGDLIIVAHSLGSVLALDLMYHLPAALDVKLLVTVGSPLGRDLVRRHLHRLQDRFPAERMGPWLNIIGQWDPVSAGRGIAGHFPEALDVFVDTGRTFPASHFASTYLDQDVVADAIDAVLTRAPTASGRAVEVRVGDEHLPILVQSQMALRLEQRMDRGDRRRRFGDARAQRSYEIENQLAHETPLRALQDNGALLKGRFAPGEATAVLLATCMGNVIAPYEIDYEGDVENRALEDLAQDMGFPARRAIAVLEAEREARAHHGAKKGWPRKAMMAAGLAAIVAAPYMVVAAAPAGLAGGAGIVAGLVALGPGGMVGGLGMVGLLGGAGGAAIAGGLTGGSAAMVEEKVVYLHALALAEQNLHEQHHRAKVWSVLVEMETSLAAEHARLARHSDSKARIVKELEAKSASVQRAIRGLRAAGLAPKLLEIKDDD